MSHTRLAVTPSDPARREAVSAALFAAGAEAVMEEGVMLTTVFPDEASAREAARGAQAADPGASSTCDAFNPGDWLAAWRDGVGAHSVGSLTITPPWLADGHDRATRIIVDPGLGFGTGEHETTRLALLLLQDVVRAGDVVADLGCGSGVLAIGAARLGASRVAAIEIDPQAVTNAGENVELNDVAGVVTVIEGDAESLLPLLAPVRVVVANIIAPVLIDLLPTIAGALSADGDVIVGGVLVAERDGFADAAGAAGWRLVREVTEGSWWSAILRRVPR